MIKTEKKTFNLGLSDECIAWLKGAMKKTCIEGTAYNEHFASYGGVCGKTGTAENTEGSEAHSWFTCYYPSDEPKYALTVFIEHGGVGGNAVDFADKLIELQQKIYH